MADLESICVSEAPCGFPRLQGQLGSTIWMDQSSLLLKVLAVGQFLAVAL